MGSQACPGGLTSFLVWGTAAPCDEWLRVADDLMYCLFTGHLPVCERGAGKKIKEHTLLFFQKRCTCRCENHWVGVSGRSSVMAVDSLGAELWFLSSSAHPLVGVGSVQVVITCSNSIFPLLKLNSETVLNLQEVVKLHGEFLHTLYNSFVPIAQSLRPRHWS